MNPNKIMLTAALAGSLLFSATASQAAVVALYDFNSLTLADSAGVGDVTASNIGLTASGFTISSTPFDSGGNAFQGATLGGNESTFGFTSAGNSLTLDFQLSSSTVYQMDELSFQYKSNSNSTTFDDYTVSVFDGTSTTTLGSGSGSNTYSNLTFDLSGIPTLNTVSPLQFTILLNGKTSNNAGNSFFGIDDITLTADVIAVPEPSSALFLLSGLGLVAIRRRRR